MFPVLAADEIERMRRFATVHRVADGIRVYETGKPSPGLLVILSGLLRVSRRDGRGHDLPVVDHGVGSFSGEVGQLSGRRSFVDGVAVGDLPQRRHDAAGAGEVEGLAQAGDALAHVRIAQPRLTGRQHH